MSTKLWPRYESDMSPIVSSWLKMKKCKVYAEVPLYDRTLDLVGMRSDEFLISVEMKRVWSHKVIHQASVAQLACNIAYAAVPVIPRPTFLERCKEQGVGILQVSPAGIRIILRPQSTPRLCWNALLNKMMQTMLLDHPQNGVGGLTSKNDLNNT